MTEVEDVPPALQRARLSSLTSPTSGDHEVCTIFPTNWKLLAKGEGKPWAGETTQVAREITRPL